MDVVLASLVGLPGPALREVGAVRDGDHPGLDAEAGHLVVAGVDGVQSLRFKAVDKLRVVGVDAAQHPFEYGRRQHQAVLLVAVSVDGVAYVVQVCAAQYDYLRVLVVAYPVGYAAGLHGLRHQPEYLQGAARHYPGVDWAVVVVYEPLDGHDVGHPEVALHLAVVLEEPERL